MSFQAAHALQLLDRARERGRLGHAYLICGPREAELEKFTARFLNLVSGTTLPDLDAWAQSGIPVLRPESKSRRIIIGEAGKGRGFARWNASFISVLLREDTNLRSSSMPSA